ncbi:MAG: helix-turn-helix domain-containing protein [Clostridia bacterium]|nr:helix-turn-helix domain-containing protein [Clostridia bacterium]
MIRIIREVYDLPPVELSAPAPRRRSAGEKLTQCERIVRHMNDYGSITSLEAMTEYGIMRLASRISDLKKAGYDIRSVTEAGKNRYGEPTSYSRYSLAGGEPDA